MSIRITTLLLSLLLMVPAALPGQVGRLRLLAEVDPQPDFILSSDSNAVMSEDGRFVFLGSDNSGLPSSRQLVSALITPGSARLNPRISTGTENILQWALSPDGTRLAGVALGALDRLVIYDVNPLTGSLSLVGEANLPNNVLPSQAPVFSANGEVVYLCDTSALNVLDAVPPLDTSPIQSFFFNSPLRGDRITVSESGNRLALPLFSTSTAVTDELVVYDISALNGFLTERARWNPPTDPGWVTYHNAALSPDGSFAHVINAVGETVVSLDLRTSGSVSVLDTIDTGASPMTLTLSEAGNVLANVCANQVTLFEIVDGVAQPLGIFSPPTTFETFNNVVLNQNGTAGVIASFNDQRILTFPVQSGINTSSFKTQGTDLAPGAIATAFETRRLLVHLQDPLGLSGDRADVFQIQFAMPSLIETATVQDTSPADLTELNEVVMSPNGNFAHATTSDLFTVIDTAVEGPSLPFGVRDPVDGRQVVLSEDGSTAAVISGTTGLSIYRGLAQPTPTATATINVSDAARLAITTNGQFVFVPQQAPFEIQVFNADDVGNITDPITQPLSSDPSAVTISPDNTLLAATLPNASPEAQVVIFDVAAADGSLSNPRFFDPPFTNMIDPFCTVVFSENGNLALIGDSQGGLHLFDTATAGATFTSSLNIGSSVSSLTAIPGEDRVLALDTLDGNAIVVDYSSPTQLDVVGGYSSALIMPQSVAGVTSDGAFGLIPNALPSVGAGIDLISLRQVGFTPNPVAHAESGTTVSLDIDDEDFKIVSLDTIGDRAFLHNLTRLQPQRLARAILIEDSGTPDGVGEPNEFLLLTFERPIRAVLQIVDDTDFRLTDGGTLGSNALLGAVGFGTNSALLHLGVGTAGIVASGETQGIDVPAFPPRTVVRSIFDDYPLTDLGMTLLNDAGVDIRRQARRVDRLIQAALGGVIEYADEADAAFTRHRLTIPAGALPEDADFTISPPPLLEGTAAFANAVRLTTSVPSTEILFNPPALLTLEVDPTAVAVEEGQLPNLVGIVQLDQVSGETQATLLPGPFAYNRREHTVSTFIDGFNPAGTVQRNGVTIDAEDAGTFATIPINPVDERTFYLGQSSRSEDGVAPAEGAVVTAGDEGAYTLHQIEFPGYVLTTESDPNRIAVTIRTANIFERMALGDGQSFPQQSGAIFTVDVADAGGSPMAFTDPVNVTVQFVEREDARETDVIDFDSVLGEAFQMQIVWDDDSGSDVYFQYLGGVAAGEVVSLSGVTNITGASGSRTFGAVVNGAVTGGPSGLFTR